MSGRLIERSILFLLVSGMVLTSCSVINEVSATPTVVIPTPTEEPITELTVCMAEEPKSLFYYADQTSDATFIYEAIYDGPYDMNAYLPKPVILKGIPNMDDGSATYQPVGINAGDTVVDVNGNIVPLVQGVQVFPRDCRSMECAVIWDGISEIQMDQVVMTFTLVDGVTWADGTNVTASDSQYSYQLAAELTPRAFTSTVERIAAYQVVDDHTIEVSTLPGLITSSYEKYFFHPLPKHSWLQYPASDLNILAEVSQTPLGWGPFQIISWQSGESITLEKNPYYFRADEGLPFVDRIEVRFVGKDNSLSDLLAQGTCDVLDTSLTTTISQGVLDSLKNDTEYTLDVLPGKNWKVLLFGITPASYDDGYYPYGTDRPDILSDLEFRKAVSQCLDLDQILAGSGVNGTMDPFAYFPFETEGVASTAHQFDIENANNTLNALGWKDYDANLATARISVGVANVPDGTKLSLDLVASPDPVNVSEAEAIKASLMNCGIQVNINYLPVEELYLGGENGILFGRDFDLALVAWQVGANLPCQLFESEEIPSKVNYWIGANDGGGNISGYSNENFDQLCYMARFTIDDPREALTAQVEAAGILENDLPFITMYFNPEVVIYRNTLCGVQNLKSEKYPYSSIENWEIYDTCN